MMIHVLSVFLLLTVASCQDPEVEAVKYLQKYGYVPTTGTEANGDDLSDVIKKFQKFSGLKPTGKLDKETIELMETPRCGVKDFGDFATSPRKWQKKLLTYRLMNYPSGGLTKRQVDLETQKAFDMWEEVSGMKFQKSTSRSADIEILFKKIDGRDGTLAYAYFPGQGKISGDAHFDDDEPWSVTPQVGVQFLNTLTHEFGHSLGLKHSDVQGSIMWAYYLGWNTNLRLADDDIKGIQYLYGPPHGDGSTTTARPDDGGEPNSLCDAKLDAAIQTSDGESYVFSGNSYWKLEDNSIAPGYPRDISDDWPGLPDDIDAAVTLKKEKASYFFKGNQFWKFQNRSPMTGYPKDISSWGELPGSTEQLPADLDAAFAWGKKEDIFFFKGSEYWKFNTRSMRLAPGYPKSTSTWKGLPDGVEAALRWTNKKTYVFKDGNYWRLNDKKPRVDRSRTPYPRDAGQWWFGCSKQGVSSSQKGGI